MRMWHRLFFLGAASVLVAVVSCNRDNTNGSDPNDMVTTEDLSGGVGDGGDTSGDMTGTAGDMTASLALTGASPAQGPTTGNIDVTLTGSGFLTGATVTIDGQAATVKSVSQSQIVVTLPARPGVKGLVTVVVTNPGGRAAMSGIIFGYYYGTITFDPAAKISVGGSPYNIAVSELENNLKVDLVATDNSSTGQLFTLSGNGDGTFLPVAKYPAGTSAYGLKVVDLNADGFNDVVVTNFTNAAGVSLLTNSKTGTFPSRTPVVSGDLPLSVDVKDVNGDGILDMIVANSGGGSNNITLLTGKAGGTFNAPVPLVAGNVPRHVQFVDVNKDGKTDIVAANESSANVSVLIGDGAGNFAAKKDYPAGAGPYTVLANDFNADGILDLLVCASKDSTVALLTGNGDGTFANPKTTSIGTAMMSSPTNIALGDVNGDGRLDVVSAIYADQKIGITLNNNGAFGTTSTLSAIGFPRGVAAADLNGDGKTDIVSANSGDGSISVFLNRSQ